MDTLKKLFMERTKTFREQQNLTQEQLGKKMSVSRITVVRWETGERTPDLDSVEKIARALNKKVNLVFEDDYDEETVKMCKKIRSLNPDAKSHILGLIDLLQSK